MDTIKITIIVWALSCITILIIGYYFTFIRKEKTTERPNLELTKQGSTTLFTNDNKWLNYHLKSWDNGMNWYAIDYDMDTKEFKILGDVEDIHPGLLEHLISWDKLTNHVSENGSIDVTKSEDLEVLNDAGFIIS
jgi:hypothetical protein